jgi:hypothetical protein
MASFSAVAQVADRGAGRVRRCLTGLSTEWQPPFTGIPKMTKFDYNDTVIARPEAPQELRPGETASIVAISEHEKRKGKFLERFPEGTVYTIEFNDGSSVEAKEADLILKPA